LLAAIQQGKKLKKATTVVKKPAPKKPMSLQEQLAAQMGRR
jgi:hypothetical protein